MPTMEVRRSCPTVCDTQTILFTQLASVIVRKLGNESRRYNAWGQLILVGNGFTRTSEWSIDEHNRGDWEVDCVLTVWRSKDLL